MPLTLKGKKVKSAFLHEYGKKRGKSIFYAYEHKHPRFHLTKKDIRTGGY